MHLVLCATSGTVFLNFQGWFDVSPHSLVFWLTNPRLDFLAVGVVAVSYQRRSVFSFLTNASPHRFRDCALAVCVHPWMYALPTDRRSRPRCSPRLVSAPEK